MPEKILKAGRKKTDYKKQLFEIINNDLFTAGFISGIAGDKLQSGKDRKLFDRLLKESEGDFYIRLLFHITHQVFPRHEAMVLWNGILCHKKKLSRLLGRNVEITVATLDYLSNVKKRISKPKLISEAFMGKIAEMSSIDPLTKLYNRQYLQSKMKDEIERFRRYDTSFSVLMIDVDDFKKINDRYGHQRGDDVLIRLGRILGESLRDLDICARYGGEEFIIVLPHSGQDEALELAERIRLRIQKISFDGLAVTVCIGCATCPDNAKSVSGLIGKADKALYRSKMNGKNRVTVS